MSIADWTMEEWDVIGRVANGMGLPWDPVDGIVAAAAPGNAMEMLERFRDLLRAEWEAEQEEWAANRGDIVEVLGGFFEGTKKDPGPGITKDEKSLESVADALLDTFKIAKRDE